MAAQAAGGRSPEPAEVPGTICWLRENVYYQWQQVRGQERSRRTEAAGEGAQMEEHRRSEPAEERLERGGCTANTRTPHLLTPSHLQSQTSCDPPPP